MIKFLLNDEEVETELPHGMTVLDLVRYHKNLKGTKIGCREGDCGACTVMVGELKDGSVAYRTMTSCLMPLANAAGKHIVTIEGINPADGSLTPVQQAMADESGTQCGFCTVGFVISLTGFSVSGPYVSMGSTSVVEAAISAIDGNICRCTGYKSIERAAERIATLLSEPLASAGGFPGSPHDGGVAEGGGGSLRRAINKLIVPLYFEEIEARLRTIATGESSVGAVDSPRTDHPLTQAVPTVVGGGTDVYVQKPEEMVEADAAHVFYDDSLREIMDLGDAIELGASVTVTDLLESPVMNAAFPSLYRHLKLVSSTPIRNMATIAGNFINASPIGDMTIWFLALNAEIVLTGPQASLLAKPRSTDGTRTIPLRRLYRGYKKLEKDLEEIITAIRFIKPTPDHYFNFEKVSKRTYLDIATVNTAISLKFDVLPGRSWTPPALSETNTRAAGIQSEPTASAGGQFEGYETGHEKIEYAILDAHVSAGGVAPIPLYLKETSSFLVGRAVNDETIEKANEIMQLEISPISDVRGTEVYKRLLLRQLFRAHFVELLDK